MTVPLPWAEGKRVVVLPMPHTSHTKYLINVAHELIKLGHELWLTMPEYLVTEGVLNTANITVIEYATEENVQEISLTLSRDRYFEGESPGFMEFFELMKRYSDTLLRNNTFFNEIRKIGPDFIIIDNVVIKMLTVIPYRLGIPFAFVGTAYEPIWQRVPFAPAVTPLPFLPYTDRMDFFERAINVLAQCMSIVKDFGVFADAVATYAPEMPYLPLDMLVAKAEIWLVEMDHILDYPKPSLPNVKLIGGTATGPTKPLPPEFQSFMDGASQGVVIMSFGSYVLNLPEDIGDKILKVLLQLPMKTVFRSSLRSPDPEKILTSSWIPQNDLLGHPNTKAFVSHCGKNGQYEALYHAVPVVAAPLFTDQFYNAERMRIKGFAEKVDLKTVTAEELRNTIMKVATDPRYKKAISKASDLFRIEFGVPMERAAFWLDHVMKYGGGHMRSAGHSIPYYQFIGLDIALFFVAVLFTVLGLLVCFCCATVKIMCRKKQKKE